MFAGDRPGLAEAHHRYGRCVCAGVLVFLHEHTHLNIHRFQLLSLSRGTVSLSQVWITNSFAA